MLAQLFLLSAMALPVDDSIVRFPSADEVVARLTARDEERLAALRAQDGYTSVRHYVLENKRHNKRAEMLVRMTCQADGSKRFETLSTSGWGGAVKHVFPRMLEAESEASRPASREQARVSIENYTFALQGMMHVDGRPVYVLSVAPKTPKKYLMRGTIWVDAEEYAIVRIEGEPAKNPSFWIKSSRFVHNYEKHGSLWLPAWNRSATDARIFGNTEVTIEYFADASNQSAAPASHAAGQRSTQ